ncbi:MAG: hypothetical protein IT328_13050 [Caldilineaceae bacterium]|nr:hypothetical protein [Caldilineaceae bacterium]
MSRLNQIVQRIAQQSGAWLLVAGLLIGCTPVAAPAATPLPAPTEAVATPAVDEPSVPTAAPVEPPAPAATPGGKSPIAETGAAVVEKIEVRILESYPVQVHVELSGYLPDGCTTIRATEVVNAGTTFRIRMTTGRPPNAMCTMVITPFQEVVPLDVMGMPSGVYQVAVNDLWAEFTLPGSGAESQP